MTMMAFGPVPSRRLGRSLGINNIPPKVCTYSCVYCQLGRTNRMQARRQPFYEPDAVVEAVRRQVEAARRGKEGIDYLALVPDGEPTLDVNLGASIRALRPLGIPIAVITNGSLLDHPGVREDLLDADWVSVKVDAAREGSWREIDRPHGSLSLTAVLEGVEQFAADFPGHLQTETMLIEGFNDGEGDLRATAKFVEGLHPETAYISVPTRPPAEAWARAPGEFVLARAFGIFSERIPQVELLSGYEGDAFASSGDARRDLLSITAVHPMRESAVHRTLEAAGSDWDVVAGLVETGELVEVEFGGHRYYLRPVGAPGRTGPCGRDFSQETTAGQADPETSS
ncbi:MAG: radical SAM protein [Longimicrobiales bacterium]